jgi:hypothetical protein
MARTINLTPRRLFYDILFEAGIRGGFLVERMDDGVRTILEHAVQSADPFT